VTRISPGNPAEFPKKENEQSSPFFLGKKKLRRY
jgi:hypothetical protein